MLKKKYKVHSLLLLLVLTNLLNSCTKKNEPPPDERQQPVQAGIVLCKNIPVYIDSFGNLNAFYDVNIVSQVTGKIENAHFTEGQFIKSGDLLFTIDKRLYQAQLLEAEATLKEDIENKKLREYILKKDTHIADLGALPAQTFATVKTDFQMADAKIILDQAIIEQNKIQLEYCDIKSPVDGIAGKREVDPGNVVIANSGPTLVNIKSIDPLYVDFTLPSRNLYRLKKSMELNNLKVIVTTEEYNLETGNINQDYIGELSFLDNTVNEATGTISLRATVNNPNKMLWPGQFVKIRLIFFFKEKALLVPNEAVQQGLNGYYLFSIDENSRAVLHNVEIGLQQEDYIEIIPIKSKLNAGDKVVTVGQMALAPGEKVRVQKLDSQDNYIVPFYAKDYKNQVPQSKAASDTVINENINH